jgi:hypothetical protein
MPSSMTTKHYVKKLPSDYKYTSGYNMTICIMHPILRNLHSNVVVVHMQLESIVHTNLCTRH